METGTAAVKPNQIVTASAWGSGERDIYNQYIPRALPAAPGMPGRAYYQCQHQREHGQDGQGPPDQRSSLHDTERTVRITQRSL